VCARVRMVELVSGGVSELGLDLLGGTGVGRGVVRAEIVGE